MPCHLLLCKIWWLKKEPPTRARFNLWGSGIARDDFGCRNPNSTSSLLWLLSKGMSESEHKTHLQSAENAIRKGLCLYFCEHWNAAGFQSFIYNLIVLNGRDEGCGFFFLYLDGGEAVNGLHQLILCCAFSNQTKVTRKSFSIFLCNQRLN